MQCVRSDLLAILHSSSTHLCTNTYVLLTLTCVRSCDLSVCTSIKPHKVTSRNLRTYAPVLRTVCPISRLPGVIAHTSSHLPLATHPASAASTQHNVRCIEALPSQEDQAYRRRNRCTADSLNVGQGCTSDYELRKNSRRSSVSCVFLFFNFYTLSRIISHVCCCCTHISKCFNLPWLWSRIAIYELGNCHRCPSYIWDCFVQCCTTSIRYYCMYELLDPESKVRRFDSNVFVLHLLVCVNVFLCVSLGLYVL